jgi:hypothetical protein
MAAGRRTCMLTTAQHGASAARGLALLALRPLSATLGGFIGSW